MAQTDHVKERQGDDRVERERVVVGGGGPAELAVAAVLKSKVRYLKR